MVTLAALWLPIVLSAVACFIAGAILWTVLPHHRSDWSRLPDEDSALDALRAQGVTPGMYMIPHAATQAAQQDPAWVENVNKGPTGWVVIIDQSHFKSMGPTLAKNFAYLLLMGVMVAYVGHAALPVGTHYLKVFQVIGTTAIIGHAMGAFPKAIFWGQSWPVAMKEMFDGVVYGLLTAGVFGWLWPT